MSEKLEQLLIDIEEHFWNPTEGIEIQFKNEAAQIQERENYELDAAYFFKRVRAYLAPGCDADFEFNDIDGRYVGNEAMKLVNLIDEVLNVAA